MPDLNIARRAQGVGILLVLLLAALALPGRAAAQDEPAPADSVMQVRLADGSVLYGTVQERGDTVVVRTAAGVVLSVPRASIVSMAPVEGRMVGGSFWPADPNPTRLFFGPTARAVGQGRGYFGVYQIVMPFLTYGVSNAFSISGGTPLIPDLIGEILYVAPKLTVIDRDEYAAAVGVLYGTDGDDGGGLVYGAGTLGDPDGALTVGLGWLVANGDLQDQPIAMIGGELRVSRNLKLLSENYIASGEEGVLASGGIRFFGEKLSADLGIITPLGLDCGEVCFFPLVNFVYSF